MSRIRFIDEFKRDAVAQVVDRGYAVSEVAERLGVCTTSLYTLYIGGRNSLSPLQKPSEPPRARGRGVPQPDDNTGRRSRQYSDLNCYNR